ncbi:MAG: SIR2 family protein [Candidatus Sumerlaeota bacterium]|nr:SIR2 family protein [Candidatus Sumerlaeota bacterium]
MASTPEMILLGAGASVPAGIPDSNNMMRVIRERYKKSEYFRDLFNYVNAVLYSQKALRNEDPPTPIDIEEFFSAVMLLANRATCDAAPFVGSWDSRIERLDQPIYSISDGLYFNIHQSAFRHILGEMRKAIERSGFGEIDRVLDDLLNASRTQRLDARVSGRNSVGKEIKGYLRGVFEKVSENILGDGGLRDAEEFKEEFIEAVKEITKPGQGALLRLFSDWIIHHLVELLNVDSGTKVQYLCPLLNPLEQCGGAQSGLTIATLNYDTTIEILAEACGVRCDTGFEAWSETGEFPTEGPGLHLLKLHGSIDWRLVPRWVKKDGPLPQSRVEKIETEEMKKPGFEPCLVFGQVNKLRVEGPFLDLLFAFRRELRRAKHLTIVGYSFRDVHVNEYISQWLNAEPSTRLKIIDPGFTTNRASYAGLLRSRCKDRIDLVEERAETALEREFGVPRVLYGKPASVHPLPPSTMAISSGVRP